MCDCKSSGSVVWGSGSVWWGCTEVFSASAPVRRPQHTRPGHPMHGNILKLNDYHRMFNSGQNLIKKII